MSFHPTLTRHYRCWCPQWRPHYRSLYILLMLTLLNFSHVTGSSGWLPPHTSWDGGGGGGLPFGWEAAADKEGRVYYVKWVVRKNYCKIVWHFRDWLFVCPLSWVWAGAAHNSHLPGLSRQLIAHVECWPPAVTLYLLLSCQTELRSLSSGPSWGVSVSVRCHQQQSGKYEQCESIWGNAKLCGKISVVTETSGEKMFVLRKC